MGARCLSSVNQDVASLIQCNYWKLGIHCLRLPVYTSRDLRLLERCWIILGWAWASSRLHLESPRRHDAAIHPWLNWHGLSFTVKPWASRRIPAMYERSCQVRTWTQRTYSRSCSLSLVPCLVTQSSHSYHSSESKLLCVLPMHSTGIVFAIAFFHAYVTNYWDEHACVH